MPAELLSEAQWRILKGNSEDALEVEFEGIKYYLEAPEITSEIKKVRRLSSGMTPMARAIKDLNRELASVQDRMRKLEAIRSGKNEDLEPLIEKWKVACQSIILELYSKLSVHVDVDDDGEEVSLGKFGSFLQRLGLDRESRHELDYDTEDDSFI